MYYLNACELLNACIKAGILQGEENSHVFVYRSAGTPKEEYPEGWYKEPFEDVAQSLISNTEGVRLLEAEFIKKEGHPPKYSDVDQMKRDMDDFMNFFQTMKDTGHCWTA